MSDPVSRLFAFLADGDISGALSQFHDDAVIEAQGPAVVPIYGQYQGRAGAHRFLEILTQEFATEAFTVDIVHSLDTDIWARGSMRHRVRITGRLFVGEWALHCRIRDQRIITYTIFEDTAALARAYGYAVPS